MEPTTYNYAEYFRLVPETAATSLFRLRWAVFEPATTCESVFPHKRNDCKFSTVKYLDGMMINWELQNTPTTDHSRALPKDIIIQVTYRLNPAEQFRKLIPPLITFTQLIPAHQI